MTGKKKAIKRPATKKAMVPGYLIKLLDEWALLLTEIDGAVQQLWKILVEMSYLVAGLWNILVQIAALGAQAVPLINRIAKAIHNLKI